MRILSEDEKGTQKAISKAKQAKVTKLRAELYLQRIKKCAGDEVEFDVRIQKEDGVHVAICFFWKGVIFTVLKFEYDKFSPSKVKGISEYLDAVKVDKKTHFAWKDIPPDFFCMTWLENRFGIKTRDIKLPVAGTSEILIGGSRGRAKYQTIYLYQFAPYESEMMLKHYAGCVATTKMANDIYIAAKAEKLISLNQRTGLTPKEWKDFKELRDLARQK